jgi:hypothetical protein
MELNKPGDAGPTYRGKPHSDKPVDGVPRDHKDRYALPQLDGTAPPAYKNGNPIGMVRASTLKSGLIDKSGVGKWREALVAEGLATSPDLIDAAARASKIIDVRVKREKLREISEEAFKRAGGKDRSQLGTDVHSWHEKMTKGLDPGDVPEEYRTSVQALAQLLVDNHITMIPELSERVAKLPFGAAGTIDNIVRWLNPDTEDFEMVVADLKTGRTLEFAYLEMLLQLWQYANAEAMAVIRPNEPISYEPVPMDLRKDRALIFHVPMDGTAQLYVMDLSGVYEYMWAAVTGRRANHEAKYKFHAVGPKIDLRDDAFVVRQDAPPMNLPTETHVGLGFAVEMHPAAQAALTDEPAFPTETVQRMMTPPVTVASNVHSETVTRVSEPDFPGQVTPQMLADAEKAKERQAAASEINPESGRKRKACSVCRLPGHTAKNCPQNASSPKYVPSRPDPDPGLPEPENNCNCFGDDDWHPKNGATCKAVEPLQYCPTAGAGGWTAVDGRWVCGCHGLPARAAVEKQLSMVSQPTSTGTTVAFANGKDTSMGVFRTTGAETVAPLRQDDSVTTDINRAETVTALTNVWNLASAKSLIQPHHNALFAARGQALMLEGKM